MCPKAVMGILIIHMCLVVLFHSVNSKWTGFSYNILCREKSCFEAISTRSRIETTPSYGTCGEQKPDQIWDDINGTLINCKYECPNIENEYPRILGSTLNVTDVLLEEFEIWSTGCSSKGPGSFDYGNYNYEYSGLSGSESDNMYEDLVPPCFTEYKVDNYEQSTHTFWIKPQEHIRVGTLVSFSQYPMPSIVLMNNRLVMQIGPLNSYSYLDNSLYIPVNQWTHVGLQMTTSNFPYMEVFINGTYIGGFQLKAQAASKRKKRAYGNSRGSLMNIQLGIGANVFRNYEGFQLYPLEIQQCIDIGYSASVSLLCPLKRFSNGIPNNNAFTNCSDPKLSSQSYLADTFFSDDHEWSVYKCPYDRRIISLFTCGYFLPAFSYENGYRGMFPCKSLCEEFFTNCGDYVKNIPSLNSSCAFYPQTNCIKRDYLPDEGIYKGVITDYAIRNNILTSREMKVLGDTNTDSLPSVEPMTNCLCSYIYPALVQSDNTKCVTNGNKDENPVDFTYRFGTRRHLDYHFKEYVLDSDPLTKWVSAPGLEVVSLDITFNDTVQVLGIEFLLASAAPLYSSAEQYPMELYLLNISDEWKPVAVLTNDSSKCDKFVATKPGAVKCFAYKNIKSTLSSNRNQTFYHIDLLKDLQKFYNETHMDIDLVTFLRAKGLRLQFNGFSKDKKKYSNPKYLYYSVADISVNARYFGGTTLCGCYPDGTDLSLPCDEKTRQCPCKSGYLPYTGKRCHPYIYSVTPGYGPKSGGTEIEILGGLFGNKEPTIHILVGTSKLNVVIMSSNDTVIKIKTGMLDTNIYPNLLGQPLKILVTLYNGYVILTDHTFTYKEDPVIHSIQPLSTFLQGGIEQTVIGKHLNSVFRPYLTIVFVDHGLKLVPIYTDCHVTNDTVMFCPSPDLRTIEGVIISDGESENEESFNTNGKGYDDIEENKKYRRDVTNKSPHIVNTESATNWRAKRQVTNSAVDSSGTDSKNVQFKVNSPNRRFYVGFKMDNVQAYRNLSEAIGPQFATMTVFIDPEFEIFDPEIVVFKPYKGDKHLFIKGRKLNLGCGKKDYTISLGGGKCDLLDLTSNEAICKVPLEAPASSELLLKDGAHKVICQVGNIQVKLGYVRYCMNALCEGPVLAGVVFVCIIAVIVLAVLVLFLLYRFHVINFNKCLPNKDTQSEDFANSQNKLELASLVHNEPIKQKSLLDRLQEYDISLYDTVVKSQLECSKMSLGQQIGQGNFGSVNEGHYLLDDKNIQVAVKSMKIETDDIEKVAEFFEEGTIMAEFKHENVLCLLGVVVEHDIPYIMLPFMEHGDLKSYLSNPSNRFTCGELIDYAAAIAKGMSYLSDLHFVHRDLAARNCMVNKEQVVKIADFGLSRDIYEKDYYAVQNKSRPMPVKWMAIECLDNFKFTSKSDVWSFGITVWEVLMRGCVPFPKVPNYNIKEHVLHGNRLNQPPFCPDKIYSLMLECWDSNPEQRPSFHDIVSRLDEFLTNVKRVQKQDQETGEEEPSVQGFTSVDREKVYDTMVDVNGKYCHKNDYLTLLESTPVDSCTNDKVNNNDVSADGHLVSQDEISSKPAETSKNQLKSIPLTDFQRSENVQSTNLALYDESQEQVGQSDHYLQPVAENAESQNTVEIRDSLKSNKTINSDNCQGSENVQSDDSSESGRPSSDYLQPVVQSTEKEQPSDNYLEPVSESAECQNIAEARYNVNSNMVIESEDCKESENIQSDDGSEIGRPSSDYLQPVVLNNENEEPSDDYMVPVSQSVKSDMNTNSDNYEPSDDSSELGRPSSAYLQPVVQNNENEEPSDDYMVPVSQSVKSNVNTNSDNYQGSENIQSDDSSELARPSSDDLQPVSLNNENEQPVEQSDDYLEPVSESMVDDSDSIIPSNTKKDSEVKIGSIFMHDISSNGPSDCSYEGQPEDNSGQQRNSELYSCDTPSSGQHDQTDQLDKDTDYMFALKPVDTMLVDLHMDNSYSNT